MDNENTTLATEIFRELKLSAKRWFIAFLVMVAVEVGTIAAFLWYISLPIEETTTTQTVEDVDNGSNITQMIGDNYGQSKTNSNEEETGGSSETEEIT